MLYVFHVDVGRMLNFDMTVALSSVENLKNTIERLHGIPAMNIVLLVSGGEVLTPKTQVSCYSAGTDTNPIYMFLTGDVKFPTQIAPVEADLDLKEQAERSLELPAVYETVAKRAQIALRMHELAREEERKCERLVHEQHLQQQGWSAVVANMEDLTEEFRSRFLNFCEAFDRHLNQRSSYLELLSNFSNDLSKLSRIPILPGLMPLAEADFHGFDEFLEKDDVFSGPKNQQQSNGANTAGENEENSNAVENVCGGVEVETDKGISSTSPNKKLKMANEPNVERSSQTSTPSTTTRRLNLLQWITSKENHNVLRTMSDECIQGLSTFNENVYKKLKYEVQSIIKLAEQSEVKEIKGLGDRLCKLEEVKYKIKSMVKDQKELSAAFQQNQSRAINLRDTSILPDLCVSHQSQLRVMLDNHIKVREHRHCIAKAKDELGVNLNARLLRVVYIENAMNEYDNRLLFYHRCLRRAENHIHIIEQIHQAPNMYVAAVTEVMRRKMFSTEFRLWASKLAKDFDSIQSEERRRRQLFNSSFEGHFLNILFPGMSDMPPAFANESPLIFDARLPNITRSDIDVLTTHLPEMVTQMQLPDMEPVIYFFVSRSGAHQRERFEELLKQKQKQVPEELKQAMSEEDDGTAMVTSGKLPLNPRLSELRKDTSELLESGEESETDIENEFEKVPSNTQHSIGTSTAEYVEQISVISKSTATDHLMTQSAGTLTEENSETLKNEVIRMRVMLGTMSKLALECIQLARSNLQTFKADSVTQKEDFQSDLEILKDKWNVLKMQCEAREQDLALQEAKREQEFLQLKDELWNRELELIKEKEVSNELKVKCTNLEAEFENLNEILKSFDGSLVEKDLHETMMSRLRMKLETEKKKEIEMGNLIKKSQIYPSPDESVTEEVNHLKGMLELREQQLKQLRERDLTITKKNYQLKTRIDLLSCEEGYSRLKENIEYLQGVNCRLEVELNNEKFKRMEMETSFAALKVSSHDQSALARYKSGGSSHKSIALESCSKGDLVLIVWSMRHRQFIVIQDTQSLFFVHGDSLTALGLRLLQPGEDTIPLPYYAFGRVIEKEYCQAKKDENRYHVNRGSKFYRVKLTPFLSRQTLRRERFESFSSNISRSMFQCESHSEGSESSALTRTAIINTAAGTSAPPAAFVVTTSSGVGSIPQDMVDAAAVNMPLATSPITIITAIANQAAETPAARLSLKERTMSITSVTEEDDEPVSLVNESCPYISLSEENENLTAPISATPYVTGDMTAATQNTNLDTKQPRSTVITEQPTATATKLEFDLMLASADIIHPTQTVIIDTIYNDDTALATASTPLSVTIDEIPQIVVSTSSENVNTETTNTSAGLLTSSNLELTDKSLPSIPTSIGTASEDSDEYRSLEPKDETDFE